jgi:hypothetical protein
MLNSLLSATVLAVAMSAGIASAATISITTQGPGLFGTNGSAGVLINSVTDPDIGPINVQAGGFALSGNIDGQPGNENFTSFCLDIATYLRLPSLYTVTSTPFVSDPLTGLQLSNIRALFNTAYSTIDLTQNAQSAGFQLALWEIIYESAATLTVASGNFTASNNAGAVAFADMLLAGLGGPQTGNYALTFLNRLTRGRATGITASIR